MLDAHIMRSMVEEAVRRGGEALVPAAGASMGAAFAEPVRLGLVAPDGARLRVGAIVVFQREGRWIAHRAIWIFGKRSPYACITLGDGCVGVDRPFVRREECVGVAVSVCQGGQVRSLTGAGARARAWLRAVWGWARLAARGAFTVARLAGRGRAREHRA